MWHWCHYQWHDMAQKSGHVNSVKWLKHHVGSHFIHLELTKQQCYWWYHQCHVMPMLTSHDQKSHVSTCFNHLDLANKMALLTMPSVSCDACTGVNSFTWPKESCHTLIQLSSSNKLNAAIDGAVSITWQQFWYFWHHMTGNVIFNLILIIVT